MFRRVPRGRLGFSLREILRASTCSFGPKVTSSHESESSMTVSIDRNGVQHSIGQRRVFSDAPSLASELRRTLEGEVRFDSGSRALYATDASNYRQVPIGVVVPKSVDDVITTIELCRNYSASVLPRGG